MDRHHHELAARPAARRLVRRRPEVTVDREEVVVVGRLAAAGGRGRRRPRRRREGRIARFREDTRDRRIRIAREARAPVRAQGRLGRAVGEADALFTTLSVPVMTRLRQPERLVLDTLVDAGRRAEPVGRAGLVRAARRASTPRLAAVSCAGDAPVERVRRAAGPRPARVGTPGRGG